MNYLKSIITSVIVFLMLLSCKDDDETSCYPQVGEMRAFVNDSIDLDFRFVYYLRDTINSAIEIKSVFINASCEQEVSLNLGNIKENKGKQTLVKIIFGDSDHPSQKTANSIFRTWNVDAGTESFELFEEEPAWLELTEINDNSVKGIFQATYVYRPSAQRFWALPDTLRFNEVYFEAVDFDTLE